MIEEEKTFSTWKNSRLSKTEINSRDAAAARERVSLAVWSFSRCVSQMKKIAGKERKGEETRKKIKKNKINKKMKRKVRRGVFQL